MCGTMGGAKHQTKDVKSGGPMTVGEPAGHAPNVKMTPKWQETALALVVKIVDQDSNVLKVSRLHFLGTTASASNIRRKTKVSMVGKQD